MAQTVMVQQVIAELPMDEWTTGLCDCFDDMSSCCFGFWCCPCLACSTSKKFGECLCLPLVDYFGPALTIAFGIPLCAPPASIALRAAIRHKYRIKGTLCEDIAISCFCDWCSWCQMARELKHRHSSPVVVNVQPVVVNMQPTPTVTTQTNLVNQNFGGPVPEYGYKPSSGQASRPGYEPPPYGPMFTQKF